MCIKIRECCWNITSEELNYDYDYALYWSLFMDLHCERSMRGLFHKVGWVLGSRFPRFPQDKDVYDKLIYGTK